MAKFRLRSKITGDYIEITQEAIETPVEDIYGYFEGKDVETVLSEIGLKIRNGVATPHDIDLVKSMLDAINDDILSLKDGVNGIVGIDTETLKEMVGKYEDGSLGSGGSGGGGGEGGGGSLEGIDIDVLKEMIDKYLHGTLVPPLVPTIETTFPEKTVIEQGDDVTFDIYFQTPNLGDGTLYIVVNNAEIDFQPTLIGGDNNITIKGSYLTKANNSISVYAKDRVGMTSNRITFTVIAGGVNLTSTFDYTVDYVVGQNILFPFNVTSEMEGDIILYRTIDGIEIEPFPCERGYNSFYLNDYITGVGSHTISMYAMNGTYKSKVLTFNVVIASSTELSLSSSTTSGSQFTYGEAIEISYRVSKLGNETFELNFYVDGELMRTANVSTGSYIWTIAAGVLSVGVKTIKITATGTSGDSAEIYLEIEVVKGAFNPVENVKGGMTILLDSDGYSNELTDRTIWKDATGNGHDAELVGFNFSTNGWNPTLSELEPSEDGTTSIEKTITYKGLVCNNDAYVRIPYKPFYNNVINGFTMELLYTPEHSGNNEARVLEYIDHEAPYVGVYASIDEAFIKSESQQTAGQIDLDYESGEIQLDFVIDREKKLCLLYIDGICTRYWALSDSGNNRESFAIDQDYIYLNFSALDSKYCGGTNVIRKFICYERALSHEEIETNWIANAPDIVEMERRHNWCYNTQIPKLQIYGDISNISSSVPAYVRIKYSSPDEEKYGASFDLESSNSPIYLQGTSSLGYSRKNYRFVLIDNNGQQYYHEMFPGNALPESTYTAKCDYVDSSMTCNVTLCKIANDTLYGPSFTDAQRDNPRRRTATYGHAIELVNVVDNIEVSLGAYTLIIDRYAEESMGYKQSEYPNILVLEGESNSDTGASSFHAYTNPESSGSQFPNETEYINEGFRVVYPPTNEAAYDFADVKELVNFVDLASDDDFKDTFESYFHKESVLKYYLFCLCFASVDTLAKNLHFVRYKDLWYILPYDCDSVLGGSNVGFLNISSSCEVGNVYDELDPTVIVEPNQYNSWNGRLWERMRNTFGNDLNSMWTTLRSNGTFNYNNFVKYFDEIWDVIPPSMYNSSQQIKYIDYGTTGQVALHGNRKHQIKKFLRERMAYLDSKFGFYSDGGAENYANIRMNTLGNVSLTVETYYPVYYTIKWATNNIETHRIAKNTKFTFKYFSDVSTDREVLLYLPHTLKTIENLDSLKPASIDISKATRLTNIEVHSDKLYSVNLANNKYLRNINFNGCSKLGTDTTSTMSIIYAKYLKTLDVRGTKLTAIDFPNAGGSIVNCYLPETITSLTVKNQLLLRNLILQDKTVDLATVEISNCPLIDRLSEGPTATQFDVFKYCRSLLINNSFANTEEILLSGFTRLQNITLSNIEALKGLGLNDLCEAGQVSGLRYVGVSNCKNLTTLTMNCSSNDYEISFAKKGLLDLSTSNITELKSNCVIKGLDTIVLPRTIKDMFFTSEYGSGYSEIFNIWSAIVASIDSSGVFPEAKHLDADTGRVDDYIGIDFLGLELRNIDLSALVNVAEAKNFNLSPTSVNPNFNKNRDGVEYPYLQPSGILNLSDYTESLAKFFDGVDLNKLIIVCDKPLPQTDLSYCFYNATFSTDEAIDTLLSKMSEVTNLDYCFYKTGVSDTSILNKINTGPNTTMNYTFAECPHVKSLINVVIPDNVVGVEGMFYKCPLTNITNMTINVRGSIKGLFKGCDKLLTIATLLTPNVTDVSSLFEGCVSLANLSGFALPDTCTNVSNLFYGCYLLTTLSMKFNKNIVSGENWYPPNLETMNDSEVYSAAVNFKDCTTLKSVNNINIDCSANDMFNGCVNLINLTMTLGNNVTSMARFLKNCAKISQVPFQLPSACTNIDEIFVGTGITDVSGLIFDNRIVSADNWYSSGLSKANDIVIKNKYVKLNIPTLKQCDNLTIQGMDNLDDFFAGSAISSLEDLTIPTSVRSMKNFLQNNKAISRAEVVIPDSVTNISNLFNGCQSLTDISGSVFGRNVSNTTNWNTGAPIEDISNVFVNTSSIKFTGITTIKYSDGFMIGDNVTNIDELFKGCSRLLTDFILPLHITSCVSAFENCVGMTHIHGNWQQTYTNGITPTNCYSGCTGITHCDGINLGVNEYIKGLDDVPPEWGGYGFAKETTGIYRFEIPNDGFVLELRDNYGANSHGLLDSQIVDWGDGTVTTGVWVHTYTTAGNYVVKMHGYTTPSNYPHTSITQSITEVIKMPYRDKNLGNIFCGCTKLTKANLSNISGQVTYLFVNSPLKELIANNIVLKGGSSICQSCTKLESIVGIETWDTSQMTSMANMFNGCGLLPTLNVSSFDTRNVTNMSGMFRNYGLGAASAITTEIIGLENFDTKKVTDMSSMFQGQANITSLNIGGWDVSKVTTVASMFGNCAKMTEFPFVKQWNLASCTSYNNMFDSCKALVDPPITVFGNVNRPTKSISYSQLYYNCTKLAIAGTTFKIVGACTLYRLFVLCSSLSAVGTEVYLEWHTDETVNVVSMFCDSKEKIVKLGNFNLTSCINLFDNYFFGGVGGRAGTYLETFNCYGVQSYSFAINGYNKLSKESILNLIDCLCENGEGLEFKLGATNFAKLTDEEIARATAKGWTVVA